MRRLFEHWLCLRPCASWASGIGGRRNGWKDVLTLKQGQSLDDHREIVYFELPLPTFNIPFIVPKRTLGPRKPRLCVGNRVGTPKPSCLSSCIFSHNFGKSHPTLPQGVEAIDGHLSLILQSFRSWFILNCTRKTPFDRCVFLRY